MLLSILLVFLYTSLTYFIWTPKVPFIKNKILKISFSWFLGLFFSTMIIFLFANLLTLLTTQVLQKASLIYILFLVLTALLFYRNNYLVLLNKILHFKFSKNNLIDIFVIVICFSLSVIIFLPHLAYKDGKIYRSEIYWDIQWNIQPIQNFIHGDNFPPENESFSGFPLTYHYFYWLATAIYGALGLNIAQSVLYLSVCSFFFVLLSIYTSCEELFKSRLIGIVTILLTLTTGSLRFIYDLGSEPLLQLIRTILTNNSHPGFASMLEEYGNPFGYNGQMFNMFYFIAERQIIPAVIYLIFALFIFIYRKHLSFVTSLIYGMVLGLYFQWHLFATVALIPSLLILFVFANERKKTLGILLGFGLIVGLNYLYFLTLMGSDWFYPNVIHYPQINFNFPTMDNYYPFSIINAVKYYLFAYGLKIPFIILGLYYIWKNNRSLFIPFVSIIISLFILTNTIQLSPATIYDNHKWLRTLNVLLDIIIAYLYIRLLQKIKIKFVQIVIFLAIILLTLSGLIELIPFLYSKPVIYFGNENSNIVQTIRNTTKPKSVFISKQYTNLHLAGRRLFLGASGSLNIGLDFNRRKQIIKDIYETNSLENFCNLTKIYKIDYVEFEQNPYELTFFINPLYFEATSEDGKNLYYLDTKASCRI